MERIVLLFVIQVVIVTVTLGLLERRARANGKPTPPAVRNRMVATFLLLAAVTSVAVYAFSEGNPLIGIALLVAVFILPSLVSLPFRVGAAKRRGDAARARRETGG